MKKRGLQGINFTKLIQQFACGGFLLMRPSFPYSNTFKIIIFLSLSGVFLTQNACFDPQDSCLDIAATNFNAAADKNCCCRYPKLILSVDQVYDTQLFRQDSLYEGTGGHLFRLKNIVFYLSDFQLFKSGDVFEMGDSLAFKTYGASITDTLTKTLIDDFTLVRRTPLDNEVASFREDGIFEKIKFRLGLNQEAGKVIPPLAPANHPLSPQTENLSQNGFVFFQAIVVADSITTTTPDTINFTRAEIGDFFIEGTGAFKHEIGYNFPMKLKADWKALFDGVNWTVHDITAWKTQIVANLPSVFSVSQ